MFTGLIEEIGKVKSIQPIAGGQKINLSASKILDDLKVDDSVAVNGVCLTATKIETNSFWVDAVGETLTKTTVAKFKNGINVNLERAVRLNDRLGGHLVQGHVNGIGRITQIINRGENYFLEVEVPPSLNKYLIDEGSIAVDGISLTIAKLTENRAGISVIPHTWANTILNQKVVGDHVNIETDVIAKYVEKLISDKKNSDETFTDEWFKNMGY